MIDFDKIELGAAGYTRKKNKIFLKVKDKFYVVEGIQQFKNFGIFTFDRGRYNCREISREDFENFALTDYVLKNLEPEQLKKNKQNGGNWGGIGGVIGAFIGSTFVGGWLLSSGLFDGFLFKDEIIQLSWEKPLDNILFLTFYSMLFIVWYLIEIYLARKKTTDTHIVQFGKSRLIVLINFLFFFLLNGFIFYYVGTIAGLYHEISAVLRLIVVVVGTLLPFFIMLVFWIPNNYIFIYKKVDIDKIDVKEKQ